MAQVTTGNRDHALRDAGWPAVVEHLIRGIGHDLNNRVQTLLSLIQLLQLDEDVTSLIPLLEKEVDQLEEVVTLIRLIPGAPSEEDELIHLPEFLPPLLKLHGIQKELEPVERTLEVDDQDLMPVRAPWTYLARSILLLLAAAAEEALARDRTLVIRVSAHGGEAVLEARAGGGRSDDRPFVGIIDRGALRALFQTFDARLEVMDEPALHAVRLKIPSVSRPG